MTEREEKTVIQMGLAVARPRGAMGGGQHLHDLFCNSSKYDKKLVGEGLMSKDLKISHQTGKTFHKRITMIYSFIRVLLIRSCSTESVQTMFSL